MKSMLFTILLTFNLVSCSLPKMVKEVPVKKFDIVAARTTAYTHLEGDHIKYGRKTAIGSTLKDGTVATDWSIFPVGTVLKIGSKQYTVEDYGSALIKPINEPPTIDVYKSTRSQMNKWGVRHFSDVEVIEWGSWERSASYLKDRLRYKHCRVMYERIQEKL